MPGCLHVRHGPCSSSPGRCLAEVHRQLTCGHQATSPCWQVELPTCKELVEVIRPLCGHLVSVDCGQDAELVTCSALMVKQLPGCGHSIELPCVQPVAGVSCHLMVTRSRGDCRHDVVEECSADPNDRGPCEEDCLAELDCGHVCSLPCHHRRDPNGHGSACQISVTKLLDCGHSQEMPCWRSASNATCFTPVIIPRSSCSHPLVTTCSELTKRSGDLDDCTEKASRK